MESARRPFGRSLSKEPGLKKPRLAEVPAAPDRSSNGRAGARVQMNRDVESSGPEEYQPSHQLHQELVNQYKTALAELTFNSKPIITNLTIIAGENAQAAKPIAATVCTNIIEVPREQKLPSLYLLDSIVKNIGRDYIKHFASRLPEVFCKTYRQVDPSTHQGMRHLFGTWKGVFPPQTLQMIEKELGFTTTANGSSSGTTPSRPDSQAQRPAQSIHVNPKYLEARQRLQTTKARGTGSEISGALASSNDDVEAPRRTTSVSSERSWADPYAKSIQHHHRDQVNDPVRDKITNTSYMDLEYDSNVPGRSGLRTGRVSEGFKEQEPDRPFDITGKLSNQKNGFESYVGHKPANSDSHLLPKQNFTSRSTNGMSRSWKNTEEEEFMWDEMNSRPSDRATADNSAKDHWTPDSYERLDFDSHLRRPSTGSRIDDEASADSLSTKMAQIASGSRGYTEGYSTGLKSSSNTAGRTPFQSQPGRTHIGTPPLNFSANLITGPKVSPSSLQPPIHHRPPSPSFSTYEPNQPLNNTSTGPPTDPRRPPGQRNTGSSLNKPQSLRSSSAVMPPLQQKKHVPSTQKRKVQVTDFESSGEGRNLFSSQISGSESRSTSDQSNPLTVDSPGQSITSSTFPTALDKSGIVGRTSLVGGTSTKKKLAHSTLPPGIGSEQTPAAVNPTSNPVSSLLSTLMAKGLISASKSDSLLSASTQKKPDQPLDRGTGFASTSSAPVSSTMSKPLVPTTDDPSPIKPSAKASDGSPKSTTTKIKNLVGCDFRPNVVRNFNPDVINDLTSDLPHQCIICGLRLQLQERLDRHMEWHTLKVPEKDPLNKTSRTWYANSVDWVSGDNPSDLLGESSEASENSEEMVPADEGQCACILCGEMFEDFYSRERNEWMFKGAVHLTIPSEDMSDVDIPGPIVHVNCMSENSVRDLGLVHEVKLEKDV